MAVAGVADSVFVGNAIGTEGLAAISLGQPVYLFYNILSYGFSIGGSIHYASKLAQGREEEGNRIFQSILKLLLAVYAVTVALGLLFLPQLMSALGADPADAVTRTYIRTQLIFVPIMFCQGPFYYFVNADNGPKLAAAAMTVSGLSDALFSYIFVYRMRLGVAGSVYSTVVGAVLMLCLTGWHIVSHKGALRFGRSQINWFAAGLSARTGFATSMRYLFEFITMIAVNRLLMKMAGPVAVAAFDVVYNISLLCTSISDGATVATEPMLSSYRSERNLGNIRFTLRLSLI
jgi:Na+-driven multidrug efflux pump